MVGETRNQDSDLPAALSRPARRALLGAGYRRLDQVAQLSEREVTQLHGVGPHTIALLHAALNARGLSFAAGKKN
jgi:hypothetical protein